MYKCRFCKHIGIRTIHGLAICHDHSKSPVLESLIIDFYKKENELWEKNYDSMERQRDESLSRPWKSLINYYKYKLKVWMKR
jgi:hypothetical protein|tara:strand:- start:1668 stop:1913 length:246 start_codon:yes stop_codon:yes gene_type:complete